MANPLTGDFEAVVQVSLRQINGMLATLHQNGADENAKLKLPHSVTMRIGDPPPKPDPGGLPGDFGTWVREYQASESSVALRETRGHLTNAAPPGVAQKLKEAFTEYVGGRRPPIEPGIPVRGLARVQMASPTLSVTAGTTSEVSVNVNIRAQYYPDPNTLGLAVPEHPIHGEVQAAFEVHEIQSFPLRRGKKLVIQASTQDSKIQFLPAVGTGLTPTEAQQISTQIRKAVREDFTTDPIDLPTGFPFSSFKGLGTGVGQALALPISLSGSGSGGGNIQNISSVFTGSKGFAIAVGKEFIVGQFQATLDNLKSFQQDFTPSVPVLPDPTYHVSVSSAEVQFNSGFLELVVHAKATTSSFGWPNYNNIVIQQKVTLILFFNTLVIVAPDDELSITGGPSVGSGEVRNSVIAARNQALPPAQDPLNQKLHDAMAHMNSALQSFDPGAFAEFAAGSSEDPNAGVSGAVAVTPDGIILRGNITSGTARQAPVVDIAETDQHQSFTALESWIPGGGIDRFVWSWVEYSGPSIWTGITKSFTDAHRFIFPKPPAATALSNICLRIEGSQTKADGQVLSSAGGTTCRVPGAYGEILASPSWWEPVTVPYWTPDSKPETVLKDMIAGHITMQDDTPAKSNLTHNTLVCFVDWGKASPGETLEHAMAGMKRGKVSLAVILVLPVKAFESRRREVEAKLGGLEKLFPGRLLITQDDEGGWTRTFAATKIPSVYLINARREFVWKHEGEAEPKELAAALDRHLLPAAAPRSAPLRLNVANGRNAPDAAFKDPVGDASALHRLRGREVLLNFWQSWSAPCLRELQRLEQLQKQAGESAPEIVALHGGSDVKKLEEIRKELGLSFRLAQDADQRIARMYGVRCWPTTISINPAGRVNGVQFGAAHGHASGADDKGAA